MKTVIWKISPYFFTSVCVIVVWRFATMTDNYAWFPKGKDLLMLDIALTTIFFYKTVFWLVIANLTVFLIKRLIKKEYKIGIITVSLIFIFYYFVGHIFDQKCAFSYYSVFQSQSVSEEYIDRPIIQAGYEIGSILTKEIQDKQMEYRRYAISGLVKINYKLATPTLTKILFDKSEIEVFRADAYEALTAFNTDESRNSLTNFKNSASDTLDKKVIELGEYFYKNK